MGKNIFVIIILILVICTVSLTYYRQKLIKGYYIDTFKNLQKCSDFNTCKKCLTHTNLCGWLSSGNICIPHPQNATGLILSKEECPEIDITTNTEQKITPDINISVDSAEMAAAAPASANMNQLSTSSGLSLQGVPQFINSQNILSQQQEAAEAARAAASAAGSASGTEEAVKGGAEAANAARSGLFGSSAPIPQRKK